MYTTNLTKISIEEFEKTLQNIHLLPSQKVILNNLALNMQRLKNKGLTNLQDLQCFLKKKTDYPAIAADTGIAEDYLVILNRMVNSYIVKILPLEKLEIFTGTELGILSNEKIKDTKQYYEAFTTAEKKGSLATKVNIPIGKIEYALYITDLIRINGVGVEYAKMLYEIGIKSILDYNRTASEKILADITELNKKNAYTKATLGISDIDYCRSFCENLDCDIYQ
jgi:hypothetical protein